MSDLKERQIFISMQLEMDGAYGDPVAIRSMINAFLSQMPANGLSDLLLNQFMTIQRPPRTSIITQKPECEDIK